MEEILEKTVTYLKDVPWFWVLITGFLITTIENLFPPAPGDSIVVFTGAMASISNESIIPLLLFTTFGSVVGFVIMFLLGKQFDTKIIHSDKFSFISRKAVKRVEDWFKKYGYWLIVANRFIAGTRAVISFFAGMSKLSLRLTTLLSAISALLWNFILIYSGYKFGENWRLINKYLDLYGKIILPILAVVALFFGVRYLYRRYFRKRPEKKDQD